MYHIATVEDFGILRSTYDFVSVWRDETFGFPMPTLSDDELTAYIESGKIIVSDFNEDNYAANICFEVLDDHINVVWLFPDNRHEGITDAMGAYLIMTYQKPYRYWVEARTVNERNAISGVNAEHTVLVKSEVNEYGKTINTYEFTAPELASLKGDN